MYLEYWVSVLKCPNLDPVNHSGGTLLLFSALALFALGSSLVLALPFL